MDVSYLARIQKGVDFIEENLDEPLELWRVAEHAGISQWHFQRIFKALTNETLKDYIRSRRFAGALEQLLDTDTRIIEIALAAGYESQESFTRAFKKAFGATPHEYRRLGEKNLHLKKARFGSDYIRHINANVSLMPEVDVQRDLCLVGMKTQFYGVDSEKNNMGEKLSTLWSAFLPRLPEIEHAVPCTCYGVVCQTPAKTELLEYYAAMEVTTTESVPEGMCVVEIPEATYARFAHKGKVSDLDHTVNYIYGTWLMSSGRRHTYGPDLEIYGSQYHPTSEQSVIHYAIPIA